MLEKPEREKDSVGQTPTHPPQVVHAEGVNAGIFSTISMVSTGQISTHFVHSENFEVARTQVETSNSKFINLLCLNHLINILIVTQHKL